MFFLNCAVENPFRVSKKTYSVFNWHDIFGTKCIEVNATLTPHLIFSLHLNITRYSHAGLEFSVCILGSMIEFNFYDIRHWDYIRQTWEER